jgi:hypothetical protein
MARAGSDDDDDDAEPGRHDGSSRTRDGPPGFVEEEEDEFEQVMSAEKVGRKARAKHYFETTRRRCRLVCRKNAVPT